VAEASPTADIRDAFTAALRALADGSSVRIEPMPEHLTPSQAADMLGISRATMGKLLDDGRLPYEQPDVHRLVRLKDVLAFQRERSAGQRAYLRESLRESVADGTYFMTAAEADEALSVARSQR